LKDSLMSRVVNTDGTGKARNQHMRTAAEMLRRLSQKPEIDAEARDLAAALVYALRGVDETVEEAMVAWEKRNYWNKVEQFRAQWVWAGSASARLEEIVRAGAWESLPMQMVGLSGHFAAITISKFMRGPETWQGAYERLLAERTARG
jgi:hypothetical protein